jgi:hypothetical protein
MAFITNFAQYPTLSASEVISVGDLQSQMTSHGLGSGIYGFINHSNAESTLYHSYTFKTVIQMINPYIIETKEHLSCFSFFSTILNNVVFKIKNKSLKPSEVLEIFEENGFYCSDSSISSFNEIDVPVVLFSSIGKFKLLDAIQRFITDYILLESITENNFIVMPINYLLHGLYDGIYNLANDTANGGSVYFDYSNPRSFIATKKSTILTGCLLSFK